MMSKGGTDQQAGEERRMSDIPDDHEHIALALVSRARTAASLREQDAAVDALARALSEAEERGKLAERERCWKLAAEGFGRPVGEYYCDDKRPSKLNKCPHGRFGYEDCESCVADAIRSGATT